MQKKFAAMLGLLLGITGILCAQEKAGDTPEDRAFGLPYFSIKNAWHIDLGHGIYLELELTDRSQLARFQNVDSLLMAFLADMKPFRDSLSDPVTGKRVDYLVDSAGRKMVRIRETRPAGNSYLLEDDQPALLRMRQDTLYILLQAPYASWSGTRYNRLTVVINRWDQLQNLVTTGLNDKMRELGKTGNRTYDHDFGGGGRMVSDHSITIKREGMYKTPPNGNYLELQGLVGIQNYKNDFAPSVHLGTTLGFKSGWNIHFVSAYWEPIFLFAPDQLGHLHTYRNDMVVVAYGYGRTDKKTFKPVLGNMNFSLGWVVHREGDFFTGSSFRLTAGELGLPKFRMVIRPGIYFNDFFKGVTPTLQFSFKFL